MGLTAADIRGAADRLRRFAPCIAQVFPETRASGGIHEVLALQAGLITPADDHRKLDAPAERALFPRHRMAVGAIGNLGLSVVIVGARLGLHVGAHLPADARPWKKDPLRGHGVEVVEYGADFSVAVAAGPDGVTFGLRTVSGDAVHGILAESMHASDALQRATRLAWLTGGAMVPEAEMKG